MSSFNLNSKYTFKKRYKALQSLVRYQKIIEICFPRLTMPIKSQLSIAYILA